MCMPLCCFYTIHALWCSTAQYLLAVVENNIIALFQLFVLFVDENT